MSADWILISYAIGVIALITALIQLLAGQWMDASNYFRKVLHCLVLMICAYVIHALEDTDALRWIFFGFFIILILVVRTQLLNISKGESYGIALFPLAFFILLGIDGLPRSYITVSALILAFSDPLAGLIGHHFSKSFWVPLAERKSVLGSATFFIITALVYQLACSYFPALPSGWMVVIVLGVLTTLSELFSWRGSDNLCIPLVAALTMQACAIHGASVGFFVGVAVSLLGMVLYKMKWLSRAGVLATLMMAVWIALMVSLEALIIPAVFLIIGSLLSKLNRGEKSIAKDDSKGRNAHQVLANGGIGMLVAIPYLLTHNQVYLILFIVVFVTTLSDTSSSEIGRYFKGRTWDIKTFKRVIPGVSGGISMAGTLAGLIGALIMTSIAHLLFDLPITISIFVAVLGFGGMLFDSVLGAYLQGKYMVQGIATEEGRKDQLISGYQWIDNSMVNFLSVAVAVLLGYALLV